MKKILLVTMLAFVFACSSDDDTVSADASSDTSVTNEIDDPRFTIGTKNMKEIGVDNLEEMISLFLEDCQVNGIVVSDSQEIAVIFESLPDGIVMLASGIGNDDKITLKIDEDIWTRLSEVDKWYMLYHELGHDVLNLMHTSGGDMMSIEVNKRVTWDHFFTDRQIMFEVYKDLE